jgi:hypothetical protein
MKLTVRTLLIVCAMCCAATGVLAHHAFGSLFDSARVTKNKGVISTLALQSPHSLLFVDSPGKDGTIEHWALELPTANQLNATQLGRGVFNPGDAIEFCGFETKDGVDSIRTYQSPEPISLSLKSIPRPVLRGKLISPAVVVLATGREIVWKKDEQCPSR